MNKIYSLILLSAVCLCVIIGLPTYSKAVFRDGFNYTICKFSPHSFGVQGDVLDSSNQPVLVDVTSSLNQTTKIINQQSAGGSKSTGSPVALTFMVDSSYSGGSQKFVFTASATGYETFTQSWQIDSCEDSGGANVPVRLAPKQISAPSASTSAATKKSTTTTTSTSASALTKPILALTTTARIGTTNQASTLDITKPISILPTQKLTYSGTTSPNAKVTLTIKSDPIVKEVTADANGAWSYTLDPKELALETGNHTVTAIATDAAGVKSDEINLTSFELKPPINITPIEPYKFKASDLLTPINYVFGGILILLTAGVIFLDLLRRRKAKNNVGSTNIA